MRTVRHARLGALAGLALLLSLTLGASAGAAPAGEGPTATGASVDKTAWWNEANIPIDTPAGIQDIPAPPNIPDHGLAVSVTAGQNDKTAGVGILPDASTGDLVDTFTLTMAEVEEPEANLNAGADDTLLQACPITGFWTQARNGRMTDKPAFDCAAASALGERSDEGVWAFDLTPIGEFWLDPFGTAAADGVVIVPTDDAGGGFQVVFDESTIDVVFVFSAAADDDDEEPFVIPDSTEGGPTGDFGAGSGSVSTFNPPAPTFDTGTSDSIDLDAPAAPVVEPDSTPTDTGTDVGPTEVAGQPVSAARPGFLEGLPGGGFVMVVIFFGLLYAMTFSLGPNGDPAATVHRQRGVSRALAARERAQNLALNKDLS